MKTYVVHRARYDCEHTCFGTVRMHVNGVQESNE